MTKSNYYTSNILVNSKLYLVLVALLLLVGCVDQNTLSSEEMETQNRVDAVVAGALFERELDTLATYNIRKNGVVIIEFDKTVLSSEYTEIVMYLRGHKDIVGVQAEQNGKEVCSVL